MVVFHYFCGLYLSVGIFWGFYALTKQWKLDHSVYKLIVCYVSNVLTWPWAMKLAKNYSPSCKIKV